MKISNIKKTAVAGVAAFALVLTACAEQEAETGEETATDAAETTAAVEGETVTLSNGVVRAKGADVEMTAIFGTLTNTTDEEINLTGFTASVDAAAYEIHEVVDGVMREKEGGLTIAAGDTHELAPGQDHMMLMGLDTPVEAGDTVDITLILGDGTEIELDPVPVRTIAAGDESYGEDGGLMGNNGMNGMNNMDQPAQ